MLFCATRWLSRKVVQSLHLASSLSLVRSRKHLFLHPHAIMEHYIPPEIEIKPQDVKTACEELLRLAEEINRKQQKAIKGFLTAYARRDS